MFLSSSLLTHRNWPDALDDKHNLLVHLHFCGGHKYCGDWYPLGDVL